jgi:hypothetical protein
MDGCEVKQLSHRPWLVASELVNKRFIGGTKDERSYVYIDDIRELIALLGEAADVLSKSLPGLLLAALEVPRVVRAQVSALEVHHKDALEVYTRVDAVRGKVLDLGSRAFRKVEG